MAKIYITKTDDILDHIVYEQYGDQENGIFEHVLKVNPGIEDRGILLPAGLKVFLPDRPNSTIQEIPVIKQIRLWDL